MVISFMLGTVNYGNGLSIPKYGNGAFSSSLIPASSPHAGDELLLGLAVRGHAFTGYAVQSTSKAAAASIFASGSVVCGR